MSNLEQDILESFSNLSEEIKSAASYALGGIAIGNLRQYLPFILREIENQPKRQYLLLHSLKEVNETVDMLCKHYSIFFICFRL